MSRNNNHADRAEVGGRLIQVLIFITCRPSTYDEISGETGTSLRTVMRDLAAIRRVGVRIEEKWSRPENSRTPATLRVSVSREWWEAQFKKRPVAT